MVGILPQRFAESLDPKVLLPPRRPDRFMVPPLPVMTPYSQNTGHPQEKKPQSDDDPHGKTRVKDQEQEADDELERKPAPYPGRMRPLPQPSKHLQQFGIHDTPPVRGGGALLFPHCF